MFFGQPKLLTMSGLPMRRKRDRWLKLFSRRGSRSPSPGLTPPSAPPSAPSSTASTVAPVDCLSQASVAALVSPADPTGSLSRTTSPALAPPADSIGPERPEPVGDVNIPPDPTDQTAAPKPISLDDVLDELEPQQRTIISQYCGQAASDVSESMHEALAATEKQKELCDEKRWKVTVGTRKLYLREKADTIIDLISKFKDLGTAVASLDPVHAGLPWAGVCVLLQIFVGQKEQKDALLNGMITALSMQRAADLYSDFLANQPPGPPANELRWLLVKLYATVLGFLAEALRLWQSGASRFWGALSSNGDLQKFPSRCKEDLENVERAASNCDRQLDAQTAALIADTKEYVADIMRQLENIRVETAGVRTELDLAKLPIAANAEFDSYDQQTLPTCLLNTRVGLLEDIAHWVDSSADTYIFWLQGIAGEGKSTVAKTVATTLQDRNQLGASFFFKRDDSDRGNARKFFTTVAAQLAQKVDGLRNSIADVLNDEVVKYEKSIRDQFKDLISNPLLNIAQSPQPHSSGLVIVVDALDECSDDDVKLVLELLAQIHHCGSFGIRTFITGRPDVPVETAFAGLELKQYRHVVLQDHTRTTIDHDINLYLTEQFKEIRQRISTSHGDWPGTHMIQELTKRSVPLFIFAATICRFIASDDFTPEEQLEAVLAESSNLPIARTYEL